jgi:hypothetical protein
MSMPLSVPSVSGSSTGTAADPLVEPPLDLPLDARPARIETRIQAQPTSAGHRWANGGATAPVQRDGVDGEA